MNALFFFLNTNTINNKIANIIRMFMLSEKNASHANYNYLKYFKDTDQNTTQSVIKRNHTEGKKTMILLCPFVNYWAHVNNIFFKLYINAVKMGSPKNINQCQSKFILKNHKYFFFNSTCALLFIFWIDFILFKMIIFYFWDNVCEFVGKGSTWHRFLVYFF